MDNQKILEIAVDFSGPYVNLAVKKCGDEKVVFTASKLMQRREASAITDFIQSALKEADLELLSIGKFTVGSGPGSFTGMRIAAAWVSGFTFGKKDILCRTVPSAFAIAESCKLGENENAAIIFDGRNREVILFETARKNGSLIAAGREAILNKEQAEKYFTENNFDHFIVVEYDLNAVKLILPDSVIEKLQVVKEVEAANLLNDRLGEFDNDLTRLHYIRPSVVTEK